MFTHAKCGFCIWQYLYKIYKSNFIGQQIQTFNLLITIYWTFGKQLAPNNNLLKEQDLNKTTLTNTSLGLYDFSILF